MSTATSLAVTLFLGSVLGGFYFTDLFRRWKSTESRLDDLDHTVQDVATLQETQADSLHDFEQRIREKKDYDESDEIEEKKYQAWKGIVEDPSLTITIWRQKTTTIRKNQDWIAWDMTENASTVVRDFYLGNSNPDFQWTVVKEEDFFSAKVSETLVNGWDSIIKIQIQMNVPSNHTYENAMLNVLLKRMIDEKKIQWSRVLIDA